MTDEPLRTSDPAFLEQAKALLRQAGDAFVLVRYASAAGLRDHHLLRDAASIAAIISTLPKSTSVCVMAGAVLPVRGAVTPELLEEALASVPEGQEFLLLEQPTGRGPWASHVGETHAELRSKLLEVRGKRVAIGPYPTWYKVGPMVVAAYVPDIDGSVHPGAY